MTKFGTINIEIAFIFQKLYFYFVEYFPEDLILSFDEDREFRNNK